MEIHPLDLDFSGYPHTIASYLVIGPEGAVLIETGSGSTKERLKARLADHGIAPPDIRNVFVTHIHLDHAGAAGWWAQQGTVVWVHHLGAPHLVEPTRLLASAGRVYGDSMNELWGEFLPAPAAQVRPLHDGDQIDVAGLSIRALETPGHASHHMVYLLSDVAFTGDIAGIRLPDANLLEVPTPPPEFQLDLWLASIDNLAARNPRLLFPTHFGAVENVAEHLGALRQLLIETTAFVGDRLEAGMSRADIVRQFSDWQRRRAEAAGVPLSGYGRHEVINPAAMCVDGLIRYWHKNHGQP